MSREVSHTCFIVGSASTSARRSPIRKGNLRCDNYFSEGEKKREEGAREGEKK
jgi:hypothetical protein